MKWWLGLLIVLQTFGQTAVFADVPLRSSNYQLNETFVGGSGLVQEGSTSYKVGESIGDTGIGNSKSTNFQTNSGFTTTSAPTLTFIVNTSSVPLGVQSIATTHTGTATFSVLNYTSYGYIVQTTGTMKEGAYTMASPSSPTASAVGTEQFGINLTSNTAPITFGSAPVQIPSGNYSYGFVPAGYGTTNNYKYVNNDTIAQATQSSGQTNYTISYIANVGALTPSGTYQMNQVLVCTGTY